MTKQDIPIDSLVKAVSLPFCAHPAIHIAKYCDPEELVDSDRRKINSFVSCRS
jgi:hypothetical protein